MDHVDIDQMKILTADLDLCQQNLNSDDSQFWRRTYVRTLFSFFEAMNSLLKSKAVQAACSGDKESFNATRIELLGDYTYRINKNGTLDQQEHRFPFVNYTAFILRCLAEESNVEASFFSDNGWAEFQKAVQIRHRLTHPKKDKDMDISDSEMDSVHEASRWYFNASIHAFENTSFWGTDAAD